MEGNRGRHKKGTGPSVSREFGLNTSNTRGRRVAPHARTAGQTLAHGFRVIHDKVIEGLHRAPES